MAWDEDHLAEGFRHSTGEGEAGEARASFSTLPTEDAGIRRPYHHAVNLHTSLAHRPDPNPNAGRGQASPEGLPALDSLRGPDVALAELADLPGTLMMLQDVGLL